VSTLKKFDLKGKESGKVDVEAALLRPAENQQMIKDYIVAIRKNLRQWSANTKGRIEVSNTGRKPHPQKGQGRARQGCLAAPQYRGGGVVFGPRPKFDQHVRINRKERRAAIRSLLIEKIQANQLLVLKSPSLKNPSTKQVAEFFKAQGLQNRRVLFLGESESGEKVDKNRHTFIKSMRNIPKTGFVLASNVNGYDLIVSQSVVVMDSAVDELLAMLGQGK
jgi:large subunit ribosomal protein L4